MLEKSTIRSVSYGMDEELTSEKMLYILVEPSCENEDDLLKEGGVHWFRVCNDSGGVLEGEVRIESVLKGEIGIQRRF